MLDKYSIEQLMVIVKAYADNPSDPCKNFAEVIFPLFNKLIETIDLHKKSIIDTAKNLAIAEAKMESHYQAFYEFRRDSQQRNHISDLFVKIGGIEQSLIKILESNQKIILDFINSSLTKEEAPVSKLTTKMRKKLPKKAFALPADRKFPVQDAAHAANAKARATQMVKKGKLSPSSKAKIDAKANKALEKAKKK